MTVCPRGVRTYLFAAPAEAFDHFAAEVERERSLGNVGSGDGIARARWRWHGGIDEVSMCLKNLVSWNREQARRGALMVERMANG